MIATLKQTDDNLVLRAETIVDQGIQDKLLKISLWDLWGDLDKSLTKILKDK